MGIQDHMKKIDREDTIQIGVWTRSSGATRVFGT
jgi:hypothetical protein